MKKILMLLLVNVAWDSHLFSQTNLNKDSIIKFELMDTTRLILGYSGRAVTVFIPRKDTLTASLLVTHNRRGIAHPHDGFVLTEDGIVTGQYLDVNKQPIKKPYTVWSYQLGVVHSTRRLGRTSLCH